MPRGSPAHQRYLQRYRAQHQRPLTRIWNEEAKILGDMIHIGHWPSVADTIEGWTFRRCPCGFDLALTPGGRLYWLRKTHSAVEIASLTQLFAALSRGCRFHLRPRPVIEEPEKEKPANA